jgi:hypothetical protein
VILDLTRLREVDTQAATLRGLRTVASLGHALRLIAEQRDGRHDGAIDGR